MHEVHGAVCLAHLEEGPGAGTEGEVPRIERTRRVALLRGLIEHPGVAKHVAQSKVSVGALRTPTYQIRGSVVSAAQFAALHAVCNQVARGHRPIRVQRDRAFIGGVGPLEHFFAASAESRVVVIPLSQGLPRRCIAWIDAHRPLQHLDGFLVGLGIMRDRDAA